MMSESEFIESVIGKPWQNREATFDSMDCYGLVILYYEHVLDINLPNINGYKAGTNFLRLWLSNINKSWMQVGRPEKSGIMCTCYVGDIPSHVGIVVSGNMILHCPGSVEKGGKVELVSIGSLEQRGRITYHKFIGA